MPLRRLRPPTPQFLVGLAAEEGTLGTAAAAQPSSDRTERSRSRPRRVLALRRPRLRAEPPGMARQARPRGLHASPAPLAAARMAPSASSDGLWLSTRRETASTCRERSRSRLPFAWAQRSPGSGSPRRGRRSQLYAPAHDDGCTARRGLARGAPSPYRSPRRRRAIAHTAAAPASVPNPQEPPWDRGQDGRSAHRC
jgi:hypothetical protein